MPHEPANLEYTATVQRDPWLLVLRVASLLALAASAALLGDYVSEAPTFCSGAAGCAEVRGSELSRLNIGGRYVPLPVFGILGFAALFVVSLRASRPLTLAVAVLGGALGLWLLAVQAFQLQTFCWLCVTTDVSALVAAAAAALSFRSRTPSEIAGPARHLTERLRSGLAAPAWWGLAALSVAAPLAWTRLKPEPAVPAAVRRYYLPDRINVVEFADFQCPACRKFHVTLKPVLKSFGERVHFVRLNKPLPSHPNARDAARAAVCAEGQDRAKGEAMADALFSARDLSPRGIDGLAKNTGLDLAAFERCMLDPRTDARVERESQVLVAPDLEGLPTTYIGGQRLVGAYKEEALRDALERAERGEGTTGVPWPVYLLAVSGLFAACVVLGRKIPRKARD